MQPFIHLHVHTQYSVLDGQASVTALVDKAIADGMPGIAITDHGNMFGIKEFWNYVGKKNKEYKGKVKSLKSLIERLENGTATPEEQGENAEESLEKAKADLAALPPKEFKAILGCEVYVAPKSRFDKAGKEDMKPYHLILLCKDNEGYHNLARLVSIVNSCFEDIQLLRETMRRLRSACAAYGPTVGR